MTRPQSTTRLHIDRTACDGRGLCVELLPELLDADPWGYPLVRSGHPEPVVAPKLADHARRAVAACPVLALKLRVDKHADAPAGTHPGTGSQATHRAGTTTA
jgi:ferredoxin